MGWEKSFEGDSLKPLSNRNANDIEFRRHWIYSVEKKINHVWMWKSEFVRGENGQPPNRNTETRCSVVESTIYSILQEYSSLLFHFTEQSKAKLWFYSCLHISYRIAGSFALMRGTWKQFYINRCTRFCCFESDIAYVNKAHWLRGRNGADVKFHYK